VQQLSAFNDSALSGVSRELVTRHLAACGACRDKQAAWKAADEALRQALAWTPNERTLEAWSSRIEMCITAERKGLPVPEFTPTLLPVIAPVTPTSVPRMRELLESARDAMLHNTRGPVAAKPGEPGADGAPGKAPPPVEKTTEPELASAPAESTEIVPEPEHDAPPDLPIAGVEEQALPATENTSAEDDAPAEEAVLDAEPAMFEADDAAISSEPESVREEESEPEPEAQAESEPDFEPALQIEPVFVPEPEPEVTEPVVVAAPRLQIEAAFVPEREVPARAEPVFVAERGTPLEPVDVREPDVTAEPEPACSVEPGTQTELALVPELEVAAEPVVVADPETQIELALVAGAADAAEAESQLELGFAPEPEVPAEPVLVSDPETHEQPVSGKEVPPEAAPALVREPEPVAVSDRQPADRPVPRTGRDPWLELLTLKKLKPIPEWSVPELATPLESTVPPVPEIASVPPETDAARVRRRRDTRSLLLVSFALLLVLLTSQFMPEVIRIPLPERWGLRVPRVEFVRSGPTPAEDAAGSRAAALRLAARQPVVPERVLQPPVSMPVEPRTPADSAAAPPASVVSGAEATPEPTSPAVSSATVAPPAATGTPERDSPAPPSASRTTTASTAASSAPVQVTPSLVPDSPATIIPVRVSKTVRLSSPASRRPPEPEGDEQWPLLCGEVTDSEGHPVEGARVQLLSFSLTVRTDRRGRFCVACPPGVRALRVEASGFPAVNRTVELSGELVETRITLPPAR